jgi:hypothetical protein
MFQLTLKKMVFVLLAMSCFLTTGTRAATVLLMTREDEPLDALDAYVVTFCESLGHTVNLLDDEANQETTDAAVLEADVVFMSESVNETFIRNKITALETPMIIAESSAWVEMGLTLGDGGAMAVSSTDIEIVKSGHFLANGLRGTVPVLNSTGTARLGMGIAGPQATVIARAALSDGKTYDVIYVYEKGAALPVAPTDGSGPIAAEMRICFGFDQVSIIEWNDNTYALLEAAVNYAIGATDNAFNPNPPDEQDDVYQDVIMSWTPGKNAQSHNLYLGTSFEDVDSAEIGSLLLIGPGIDANTFDPGRLEFGQTYYWRIDKIGSPPESEVLKGDIWSFTVEPFARKITADSITATASSQAAGQYPENTINESGLVDDLHSIQTTDMWATAEGESLPAWIQYEFDKIYQLNEMQVWNYNGQAFLVALGLQDVAVESSMDGVNWTLNDSVSVFNKATGKDDYAANTTVPFGDVSVRYVKITANSNWGGGGFFNQYGLSEVRFMQLPVSARMPTPDDGATDVAIDVTLGWRAGREATEHNVYISTNEQAVIGGTVAAETVGEARYGPLSLDLGTTYYWRVDEVNNAEATPIWQGGTWSFMTREYLVVDDFESYNDIPMGEDGSNLVYLTWIDGYDNPSTNGSTVGYTSGASLEMATVRSGHSAPLMYNNTTVGVSKITANANELQSGSNWTVGSPKQLVIWIYGSDDNPSTDRMYVEVDGVKRTFSGDIAAEQWQDFTVDLASLGIDLSNVGTVTIGLEKTVSTGGSGTVFIDDIWLYSPAAAQ